MSQNDYWTNYYKFLNHNKIMKEHNDWKICVSLQINLKNIIFLKT